MISTKQLVKDLTKRRKKEAERLKRKALKSGIRKLKYRRLLGAGKVTSKVAKGAGKAVGKVITASAKGVEQVGRNINKAQAKAKPKRKITKIITIRRSKKKKRKGKRRPQVIQRTIVKNIAQPKTQKGEDFMSFVNRL